MKGISEIKPANFFLLMALFWYLLYLLVMPPFQSPDEYNHFYRAFRISQGDFLPHQENRRLGGNVPSSFEEMITPFHYSNADEKSKLSSADILRSFTITIKDSITEFKDFPNTSYYSPVSYLPQSIAVFVCYQLNVSVGALFYSARLAGFLAWLIVIYYAIKITPRAKWLFVLLNLLPMQLYVSNSLSADNVTNMLSYLWLALVLKTAYDQKPACAKKILVLAVLAGLLALAKIVYIGLIVLLLIIPTKNFGSFKRRVLCMMLVSIPAVVLALMWSRVVMNVYLSYDTYNEAYRAGANLIEGSNYYLQKAHVINHPIYFFESFFNSLVVDAGLYFTGYIGFFGMFLGLPLPLAWCVFGFVAILFVALFESQATGLNTRQSLVLVITALGTVLIVFMSQYLTWAKVGVKGSGLLQGRYLFPVLPLLFLVFTGAFQKKINSLPVVVFVVVCLLNSVSCKLIYHRYFGNDAKTKIEFVSDVEKSDNGKVGTTSNDILLENAGIVTDADCLSGTHSVVLLNDSSETFIYRFKGLKAGDWLKAEVWHKGEGGRILVYGKDNTQEYVYEERGLRYSGPGPWQLMRMRLIMDKNAENADFVVKVTNTPGGKVYFDDFHFILKRY